MKIASGVINFSIAMKKLIIVADWGADSLTCQEVRSAIEGFLPRSVYTPNIRFVASTPSTLQTSFIIAQLVEVEEKLGRPKQTVIFQNTDPRLQTRKGVKKAEGADMIVVKLSSGLFVCGPNAGYDFSLIKEKIEEIYICNNKKAGSQFRSRDLYSEISAKLMTDKLEKLDLTLTNTKIIPKATDTAILHIDNYGNIKTNIKLKDFLKKYSYGDNIKVSINDKTCEVLFVDNLFGAIPGVLIIYPGSSGKKQDPYLEISVRREFTEEDPTTGLHAFANPRPGQKIIIEK